MQAISIWAIRQSATFNLPPTEIRAPEGLYPSAKPSGIRYCLQVARSQLSVTVAHPSS